MGDLYKCKKCGQLLYGAAIPEINGEAAWNILKSIEQLGFYDSPQPVDFLESDFSDFLAREDYGNLIRYRAYTSFLNVMANMHYDNVTIATKSLEDGKEKIICSTCHGDVMFNRIGRLPTTFIDGKWDDYVDSDHTWYILSDSPLAKGSFTELENRELNVYISQEDRLEAQKEYEDIITECRGSVQKSAVGFAKQADVDLTKYFKMLLNIKTDIQMLETRLFDLLMDHVVNNRDYINSTSKTEETVIIELEKTRNSLAISIDRLEKATKFHMRDDWETAYDLVYPVEPHKPILVAPKEPEYRLAGLFNKKQVTEENDALRKKYEEERKVYQSTLQKYNEDLEAYKKACEEYAKKKQEIFQKEEDRWFSDPEISAKVEELNELKIRMAETKLHSENPLFYAEDTLKNSSPVCIKYMFDDEIERNKNLLKKAYQIETDLQTIMFVFPKYLDIVAVSKIYEYLVTGRCTQLTGTNGAYRLYETELRANRAPVDTDSLQAIDDLAQREFTIYSMLSSVSNVLNEITEKTTAAVDEIRFTADSRCKKEYDQSADAYYGLIDEELNICTEFLAQQNISFHPAEAETKPETKPEEAEEPKPQEETREETAESEPAAEEVPEVPEETTSPEPSEETIPEEPVIEESVPEPAEEPVYTAAEEPAPEAPTEPVETITAEETAIPETIPEEPSVEVKIEEPAAVLEEPKEPEMPSFMTDLEDIVPERPVDSSSLPELPKFPDLPVFNKPEE